MKSGRIRCITLLILLAMIVSLFSACAVEGVNLLTAEVPSVENGYIAESNSAVHAVETESVVKLAEATDDEKEGLTESQLASIESILFDSTTGIIYGYDATTSTDVYIPATIGGVKVVAISAETFLGKGITSLEFAQDSELATIGASAFRGNSSLSGNIVLPATVTSIEEALFYGCSSIKSVTIQGDSITSIGDSAFYGCTSLSAVTITSSVKTIGSYAFYGCSSLTDLGVLTYQEASSSSTDSEGSTDQEASSSSTDSEGSTDQEASSSLESIGTYAFYETAITSIQLPETLETISNYAFGYTKLTSVSIPGSVTSMGSYVFYYCTSLESATFDSSSQLTSIGSGAFYCCTSLESVVLPETLTSIASYAFYYCSTLSMEELPENVTTIGSYAFYYCSKVSSITLPSGLKTIGTYGFYRTGLTSITIPKSVTILYNYSFGYCTSLKSMVFETDDMLSLSTYVFSGTDYIQTVTFTQLTGKEAADLGHVSKFPSSAMIYYKDTVKVGDGEYYFTPSINYLNEYIGSETEITIPASFTIDEVPYPVYTIGSYFVYYNSDNATLEKVSFASDSVLKEIDAYAFYYATGLKTITLPESLETIGSYAFRYASSLEEIEIPAGVETLSTYALANTTSLNSITLNEGLEEIAYYAFIYSGLTEISIPKTVTTINSSTFSSTMKTITIDAKYDTVANSPWGASSAIVYWSDTVQVDDFIFYLDDETLEASLLKYYPDGNTSTAASLDDEVSDDTSSIDCVIPSTVTYNEKTYSVTSIAKNAFTSSTITSIDIPSTVETIGSYAFSSCKQLSTVKMTDSVTELGSYAFHYCSSLTTAQLSKNITSIPTYSFYECEKLSSITWVGEGEYNVTSVGERAFFDCYYLEKIILPDSVKTIGIWAFYKAGYTAGTFTIKTPDTADETSTVSVFPASLTSVSSYAFSSSKIVYADFSNSLLSSVGSPAFSSCEELIGVSFPSTTTIINSSAFSGCSSLESVEFAEDSSLVNLYSNAFYNCSSLKSISIPSKVTAIGDSAFYGCKELESVVFEGNSVTSIGAKSFYQCTSLEEIEIPYSVKTIGTYAFYGCTSLESLIFDLESSVLATISAYAFAGCTSLGDVEIPASVNSISSSANGGSFAGVLGTIYINETRSEAGSYALDSPWGASGSAWFLGEFVEFDYTVEKTDTPFERKITITAEITEQTLADDEIGVTILSLSYTPADGGDVVENSYTNTATTKAEFTYIVSTNGEYQLSGTSSKGASTTETIVIEDIGMPTIQVEKTNITQAELNTLLEGGITEEELETLLKISATLENGDSVETTITAGLDDVSALTQTSNTATITVSASNTYNDEILTVTQDYKLYLLGMVDLTISYTDETSVKIYDGEIYAGGTVYFSQFGETKTYEIGESSASLNFTECINTPAGLIVDEWLYDESACTIYATYKADMPTILKDYSEISTTWKNDEVTFEVALDEFSISAEKDGTFADSVTLTDVKTSGATEIYALYLGKVYAGEVEYLLEKTAPTITVTTAPLESLHNGSETIAFTVEDEDSKADTETISVSYKASSGEDVIVDCVLKNEEFTFVAQENAEYTIFATDIAGNQSTQSVVVSMIDATLLSAEITANDLTYSATPQTLATFVSVFDGASVTYSLEENGEYTSEIPTATDKAIHTVYYIITKDGYETQSGSVDCEIKALAITVQTSDATGEYNGEEFVSTDIETVEDLISGHSVTITSSSYATDVKDTGTAIVIDEVTILDASDADVTSNYDITTQSGTFTITAKEVEVSWSASASYTYTGSALTAPTATYTDVNGYLVDLTVAQSSDYTFQDAGNYTFTASTSSTNYTLKDSTTSLSVKILKKGITKPTADTDTTYTYTGESQTYSVKATGYYSVSGNTQTNAGDYTATYSLSDTSNTCWGDDGGTEVSDVTIDWTIAKASVTVPTIDSKSYTGETLTSDLATTSDYTVTLNAGGTDVGEYDVTLKLIDSENYAWPTSDDAEITLKFKITQASNTVSDPTLEGWTYGETASTPSATASFGTVYYTYSSSSDGTFESAQPTTAGTYYVKANVDSIDNYEGAVSNAVSFTIAKQTVTVPTAVSGLIYNGGEQTGVTATTDKIASNSETLLYSLSGNVATSVGNHTATATLGDTDNYEWDLTDGNSSDAQSISWSISTLAVTITANNQTITYGDSIGNKTTDVSATLATNDAISEITLSQSITDVGTGTITPSSVKILDGNEDVTSNYSITYAVGDLTIEQKSASVTVATDDDEITYGEDAPTYAILLDGFVESDEISGADFTATTTYAVGSYIGDYDFVITNADETYTNYSITYVDSNNESYDGGDFEVVEREVTLVWTAPTDLLYDGTVKVPTIEESNLVSGDNTGLSIELTENGDNVSVGTFTFTASITNANYKLPENYVSPEYVITAEVAVASGTASGVMEYGETITITADAYSGDVADKDDIVFDAWVQTFGTEVTLADVNSAETTFTMGGMSVAFEATYKYATPEITINYETNKLEGFKIEDGSVYQITVDGSVYSTTTYNLDSTAIPVSFYGKTINIVKLGTGDVANSDVLEISISALPTVDVTVVQPTINSTSGSITANTAMKYRVSGESEWTAISQGGKISGIDTQTGDVTYEFMIDAVEDSSFASLITQVVIYELAYSEITIVNGTIANPSANNIYQTGTTITITPATAPDGKEFARWSYSAGSVVANSDGKTYTYTVSNVDVTISAVYEVVGLSSAITVDYINETIGTFSAGTYLINGEIYVATQDETSFAIDDNWYGKDIRIFAVLGEEGAYEYSSTYSTVSIPEVGEASAVEVTQPSESGGTGSITLASTMAYSTDGETWTAGTGEEIFLSAGTYYVRDLAVEGVSFASNIATVKVVAFTNATVVLSGDVTIDSKTGTTASLSVGAYQAVVATETGYVPSYLVVTADADGDTTIASVNYSNGQYTAQVSILEDCSVSAIYQFATPTVLVDYQTEMLDGFTENGEYTINGKEYTADENGEIAIDTLWFATDIEIVKLATEDVLASESQTLTISSRQSRPEVSSSKVETNVWSITGVTTAMEYRVKGDEDWTAVTDLTEFASISTEDGDLTYEFRYSATGSKFKSISTSVTLYSATTYTITVDDGNIKETNEYEVGDTIELSSSEDVGEEFSYWATTGSGSLSYSIYTDANTYTVGYSDATITAQFTYQGAIFGNVVNEDDEGQAGVNVYIYQGDTLIYSVQTNSQGAYQFSNLPYGAYQLIVKTEVDGKDVELSMTLEVSGETSARDIVIPMGGISTKVDDKNTTNATSVEGLDSQVADNEKDGSYEVSITLTKNEIESDDHDEELVKNNIEVADDSNIAVGLVIDYTYEKSSENVYSGEVSTITQPDGILAIYQYLPEEMWDKQISIVRVHDGEAAVLGYGEINANEYGEYYELKGQYVIIYTSSFSEYIFAYDPNVAIQEIVTASTTTSSGTALDTHAPTLEATGTVVTASDANLSAVYINGEKYEVSGSTFEIDLADLGDGEYEIVAWDKYGRTTTQVFTVSGTDVEAGDKVEEDTGIETPTVTETPTTSPQTENSSSSFPWIWIILAVVAVGAVGYVVYKKKSNK